MFGITCVDFHLTSSLVFFYTHYCYDMICFKTIIRQLGSYHGLFGIQKHIGPLQKVKVKYHLRVKYHLCINLGRSLIQLINDRAPNKCDQGRIGFRHSTDKLSAFG